MEQKAHNCDHMSAKKKKRLLSILWVFDKKSNVTAGLWSRWKLYSFTWVFDEGQSPNEQGIEEADKEHALNEAQKWGAAPSLCYENLRLLGGCLRQSARSRLRHLICMDFKLDFEKHFIMLTKQL